MTAQPTTHQTPTGTSSPPAAPLAESGVDPAAVAAFAERCVGFMNQAAIALLKGFEDADLQFINFR